MKKETNRKIFIITGSDCSGKSKLGHLLGSHKDALFSYATTPYQEFFDEENFKIYDNKIEALKKLLIEILITKMRDIPRMEEDGSKQISYFIMILIK